MPVDFTGFVVGVIIWVGGTIWSYRQLRATSMPSPLPVLCTVLASVVLVFFGFVIAFFYDWLRGRAHWR